LNQKNSQNLKKATKKTWLAPLKKSLQTTSSTFQIISTVFPIKNDFFFLPFYLPFFSCSFVRQLTSSLKKNYQSYFRNVHEKSYSKNWLSNQNSETSAMQRKTHFYFVFGKQ